MARVFISYAMLDRPVAGEVVRWLRGWVTSRPSPTTFATESATTWSRRQRLLRPDGEVPYGTVKPKQPHGCDVAVIIRRIASTTHPHTAFRGVHPGGAS